MPTVRARQRPVLTRNDPLDIFGTQCQQSLLIAAADCREKILYDLNIVLDAHRDLSFPYLSTRQDRIEPAILIDQLNLIKSLKIS
jgi:hypothetical protein